MARSAGNVFLTQWNLWSAENFFNQLISRRTLHTQIRLNLYGYPPQKKWGGGVQPDMISNYVTEPDIYCSSWTNPLKYPSNNIKFSQI